MPEPGRRRQQLWQLPASSLFFSNVPAPYCISASILIHRVPLIATRPRSEINAQTDRTAVMVCGPFLWIPEAATQIRGNRIRLQG